MKFSREQARLKIIVNCPHTIRTNWRNFGSNFCTNHDQNGKGRCKLSVFFNNNFPSLRPSLRQTQYNAQLHAECHFLQQRHSCFPSLVLLYGRLYVKHSTQDSWMQSIRSTISTTVSTSNMVQKTKKFLSLTNAMIDAVIIVLKQN